ncbi:universal stress protein [Streptomyces sp. NPDC047813]|uniref:universal stress protein n=1 Tax=Streptomyces sp. NPDC047813 TaxID=3154608 RepID=UPI0033C69879
MRYSVPREGLYGCDLIVLGRHGEDRHLRGTGLGPVARALVHSTRLPVLLVSPPESGQGE